MEHERKTRTAESNCRAEPHSKKLIPYKEYAAHKEAERRILTTSKPALEGEENWDEKLPLPPHETSPVSKPMAPSQEDGWKLMVDQDPCSGSVALDSGHGTMTTTWEDEPIYSTEDIVWVVGGVNESITAEHLSDVKWRDDDILCLCLMMRISLNPKHQLLLLPQFRHEKMTKLFPHSNHPWERNLASES